MHNALKLLAFGAAALLLGGPVAQAQEPDQPWNAIALDMEGGYGVAANAASEAEARQQAIEACGKDTCQDVLATQLPCMSVWDTPELNYTYGWSTMNTQQGATLIAQGYCVDTGASQCSELVTQCIAPPTAPTTTDQPTTRSPGEKSKKDISN